MRHDEKPQNANNLSEQEFQNMLSKVMNSPYSKYVKEKTQGIEGKTVISSLSGCSGYILLFKDDSYLVCYLKVDKLDLAWGSGKVENSFMEIINSFQFGDASKPLSVDLPYGNEPCDLSNEVNKTHGQTVTGIAIGERTFNICFAEGMELDAMIVPDLNGKDSLRVFWEQW
jgi:hypothetical protein